MFLFIAIFVVSSSYYRRYKVRCDCDRPRLNSHCVHCSFGIMLVTTGGIRQEMSLYYIGNPNRICFYLLVVLIAVLVSIVCSLSPTTYLTTFPSSLILHLLGCEHADHLVANLLIFLLVFLSLEERNQDGSCSLILLCDPSP